MRRHRSAILACTGLAWVAALSTVIVDVPGDRTEFLIYSVAITLAFFVRTDGGADIKHIGAMFYNQGLHDGLRRAGMPQAEADRRNVVRLPRVRFAVRLAVVPILVISIIAILVATSPGLPMVAPATPDHGGQKVIEVVFTEGSTPTGSTVPSRKTVRPRVGKSSRAPTPQGRIASRSAPVSESAPPVVESVPPVVETSPPIKVPGLSRLRKNHGKASNRPRPVRSLVDGLRPD